MDRNLAIELVRVSEFAALAASKFIGRGDEKAADQAAVDAMRNCLNSLTISGKVVIGEGERDEAPMLYIGEEVGLGGPKVDIALDPLEGTTITANGGENAMAVIALAQEGGFLNAPDVYMEKISANVPSKDIIDLDYSVKKNISNLADYKNKQPNELSACILDRPRHKKIIEELRNLKVNLKLISDGDVSGALLVSDKKYNIDIFMGIGGGPEGVLAASALDAFDCFFQGRFIFDNENDVNRAKKMGIDDLNKKYLLNEIITGDSIFCATGITNGDIVSGIKIEENNYISETLITHKSNNLKKIVKSENEIDE